MKRVSYFIMKRVGLQFFLGHAVYFATTYCISDVRMYVWYSTADILYCCTVPLLCIVLSMD